MKASVFRILSYIKHLLTAWNSTGEGIHSPWLFYIVRMLMRDENRYYCWSAIERRRHLLTECRDTISVTDYGTGGSPEGKEMRRRVCDIARTQLESPKIAQLLFRLAVFLGSEEHRALEILELGTSLGITTAYLASADSRNHVVTLEGSEAVAAIAEKNWRALGLKNIACETGKIDDTLYIYARKKLDLVFIDANHTYDATMRYADYLLPRLTEKGILIVDDIYYSEEMARAWEALKADKRVTTSMDLYDAGLLFVDPHYLKKHYKIRI